jgi:hypothetical protein
VKTPGIRHSFKARDKAAFATLRAELTTQARLTGLSSAISRIENGNCILKVTADKILEGFHRLGSSVKFTDLFESCSSQSDNFGWKQITEGADLVGADVFTVFQPDVVLTFSGASSLFAGLVMARTLTQERLGEIPTYMGLMKVWETAAALPNIPGFDVRESKGFLTLIPKALTERDPAHEKKIAIIDDQITTGAPYQELRQYFYRLGYKRASIHVACCVYYEGDSTLRARVLPDTVPDYFALPAFTEYFQLPWGRPISYPRGRTARDSRSE